MEFLLIWVLTGNFLDSGLRFDEAGSCYASAQNSGMELRDLGMPVPKFICIPVAEDKELRLLIPDTQRSNFPFN